MREISVDIIIFGAGIAGLWTFHAVKQQGYNVLLLEKESIGGGQTISSQGIIHSGLKFTLAGKINKLARSISAMPQIWKDSLTGKTPINLTSAKMSSASQHLLIPAGFMGGLTTLVAKQALGNNVRSLSKDEWSENLKNSGFNGSIIFMDEPVLDIPTVLRALAEPYINSIKKIPADGAAQPFKFLTQHNIRAKRVIFTTAADNHLIASKYQHDQGLATQKRPLLQGMIKNAPFPLFAHLVGKSDKPLASITTHTAQDQSLIWYIGGGAAERTKESPQEDVFNAIKFALNSYMPNLDLSQTEWATHPIDRVEGKSKTDSWMPDTPTIHNTANALYCWPTKLTFAPMLAQMIEEILQKENILPSNAQSDFSFLPPVSYSKTPWDSAQWTKYF